MATQHRHPSFVAGAGVFTTTPLIDFYISKLPVSVLEGETHLLCFAEIPKNSSTTLEGVLKQRSPPDAL
jgi:hypothetical protein